MFVAVGLAVLFPNPGAHGGWLHAELLNKFGVALIFFLHGVGLSFSALKGGMLRWPLHLVIQGSTFLLFPLIGLGAVWLAGDHVVPDLRLGFFYLCALPSTISSSVAMTAAARGNVASAVFNATLSGLIGVFLTPLWIAVVLKAGDQALPVGAVILDLLRWLVLPLVIGQLCRPWLGAWVHQHKKFVQITDRSIILILVYSAFCDSMKWGVWSGHGPSTVLATLCASLILFFLVMSLVGFVCDALKFPVEDRIAAIFCGSKKTLASGIPMAQLIFAHNANISLILLPIMIYHLMQLIICGWLAGRWAQRR